MDGSNARITASGIRDAVTGWHKLHPSAWLTRIVWISTEVQVTRGPLCNPKHGRKIWRKTEVEDAPVLASFGAVALRSGFNCASAVGTNARRPMERWMA
jgi:hypothetical protein